MLLLAAVVAYGSLLFNAVELGENMRFRLSVEPEILALSAATLAAALSALRRAVMGWLRPGLVPGEAGPPRERLALSPAGGAGA